MIPGYIRNISAHLAVPEASWQAYNWQREELTVSAGTPWCLVLITFQVGTPAILVDLVGKNKYTTMLLIDLGLWSLGEKNLGRISFSQEDATFMICTTTTCASN
jgi:hypothetical protein